LSNNGCGGAVFVQSHKLQKTPNPTGDSVVILSIVNSTFTDNVSLRGGAVCVAVVENLIAKVVDSLFVRNIANSSGAALFFQPHNHAEISLRDVHFIENTASAGGIVHATALPDNSFFNFRTDNVWFIRNKINAQDLYHGILLLRIKRKRSSHVFKNTHFIQNVGKRCTTIYMSLLRDLMAFHFVTINACTFKRNDADLGAFVITGQAILTCKDSIFDSNVPFSSCRYGRGTYAFRTSLGDSNITISNSTFVNNYCGAVSIQMSNSSFFKTENSVFVGNRRIGGLGGAMAIIVFKTGPNIRGTRSDTMKYNALIKNVSFKENIAIGGSVLLIFNGKIALQNCKFLNNSARFKEGQIASFGWTDMEISESVFNEMTQKNLFINRTEFTASGFLRIHSTGKLLQQRTRDRRNLLFWYPRQQGLKSTILP
jgi:hypothetical protein